MKNILLLIIPLFLFSKSSKVEEVLTKQNDFKILTSIDYNNIKQQVSNHDYVKYGIDTRYGLNDKIEISIKSTFFSSNKHFQTTDFQNKHEKGFRGLTTGLTYELKKEDSSPSVLIGTNIDIINRTVFDDTTINNQTFKGYSLFATSFYTIDPIVFVLTIEFKDNLKKEHNNIIIKEGDVLNIGPKLYFAINPDVSINLGLTYSFQNEYKKNNKVIFNKGSSVQSHFGVDYSINSNMIFHLLSQYKNNFYSSNNKINLILSYSF